MFSSPLREFIDYVQGMAKRLKKEHTGEIPYLLKDLPPDHAARLFARKVNPPLDK